VATGTDFDPDGLFNRNVFVKIAIKGRIQSIKRNQGAEILLNIFILRFNSTDSHPISICFNETRITLMINAILLIIIALCYIILRRYLKKRLVKTRTLSDEDYLVNLTLKRGMSAYEIFHIAGKPWNQPESKGDIPHYVRDYVRKNIDSNDLDYDLIMHSGGKHPPSWLA
jgi:hypothetical protein